MQIQDYQTPQGYVDFPFVYVYDASALADASSYHDLTLQLQGDAEFVLRSIKGVPNCVAAAPNGRFNYRNPSQSYPNSVPSSGFVPGVNEWVLPEKVWPQKSYIYFDLYNVLRSLTVCGLTPIYSSQIAFGGVKRFAPGQIPDQPHLSAQRFRRAPQTFAFSLTINWAHFDAGGNPNPVRQFTQQVQNYDFELLALRISQVTTPGSIAPLVTPDFSITLYDAHKQATSSLPVPIWYLNSARATPQTTSPYRVSFPCPPLVYPVNSQMWFDVQSNLCSTSIPQSYAIDFIGAWRIPK